MATHREWMRNLKAIKKEPRALTPAECDELILLLGGTTRPNHRPEVKIFGGSLRRGNWTAIAELVFGFLENAERLERLEAEIKKGTDMRLIAEEVGGWTPAVTTMEQASFYVARHIENLRPRAAKNRATAERMASEWFAQRGAQLRAKHIQNELGAIQQAAGLSRLGLAEWRKIKEDDDATPARCAARASKEAEREKNSQTLFEEICKEFAQMKQDK